MSTLLLVEDCYSHVTVVGEMGALFSMWSSCLRTSLQDLYAAESLSIGLFDVIVVLEFSTYTFCVPHSIHTMIIIIVGNIGGLKTWWFGPELPTDLNLAVWYDIVMRIIIHAIGKYWLISFGGRSMNHQSAKFFGSAVRHVRTNIPSTLHLMW